MNAEFYTDYALADFGVSISMDDAEKLFGDNVCVLDVPEAAIRAWWDEMPDHRGQFSGKVIDFDKWITEEQTADEMYNFFWEKKKEYNMTSESIGLQKYIDAVETARKEGKIS